MFSNLKSHEFKVCQVTSPYQLEGKKTEIDNFVLNCYSRRSDNIEEFILVPYLVEELEEITNHNEKVLIFEKLPLSIQ